MNGLYVRIDFENCDVEYDYTIASMDEVRDYVDSNWNSFAAATVDDLADELPKITITPLPGYTDEDYANFVETVLLPNA